MKRPGHKVATWLAHVALWASILGLAVAGQDRANLPLIAGLVATGTVCLVWLFFHSGARTWQVLLIAVGFRLTLFGLAPSLSDDAYRYVWDGLVQAQGINPYQFVPADPELSTLQEEPVYELINSTAYFSVYPPVSQWVFRMGAAFHQGDWRLSYYAIKGFLVAAEIIALFLLARLTSTRYLLLYAWSPFVVMETAGQAHTESLLLLALAAVLLLARAGRAFWASVTLAVAGWVKLFPFLFFPFLWRRFGWRAAWPGLAAAILLALPFAGEEVLRNVASSLDLYVRLFEFNAGFYYGLKEVLRSITGEDWSKQLGPALRMAFLASLVLWYALDAWGRAALARSMLLLVGAYLVLSTTVHPWYLLTPLMLCAALSRPGWHWIWLGVFSSGTYMLYADGPYWPVVAIGWGGWLVLAFVSQGSNILQWVLRARARLKYHFIKPMLPPSGAGRKVLDLGCGEGYVGAFIKRHTACSVTLADVLDINRTTLPHMQLRSDTLPWKDGHFDAVVLCLVLHHARDPYRVLQEALRVGSGRVIIVESVSRGPVQAKILTVLDTLANRLRSFGRMKGQEEFLEFRTESEWRRTFQKLGAHVLAERSRGVGPFRESAWLVALPD